MCTLSDRYVAVRTCACSAAMQERLDDLMDDRDDLQVEVPTEDQFDTFADLAIQVCAEFAFNDATKQ